MPIYNTILNMIQTYLYGTVQSGSFQELTSILLATVLSVAVFAIPFVMLVRLILWIFEIGR